MKNPSISVPLTVEIGQISGLNLLLKQTSAFISHMNYGLALTIPE
jgi:hypothetical protein